MRGNQPGSPCTLFQELISASWSSSSIHTYMKPEKSTGPVFPPWELCQMGWALWGSGSGFCGSGRVCREAEVAVQEGISVPRKDCRSQLHGERGYKEIGKCRKAGELGSCGLVLLLPVESFTVLRGRRCFILQQTPLACRAALGGREGRAGEVWVWRKSLQVCLVLLETGPNYEACGSQRAQWEHRVQTQS